MTGEPGSTRKQGCARKTLGCLGLLAGVAVLYIVLPGMKTRMKHRRIQPGMTVEAVLEAGREWLLCQMSPTEPRQGARRLRLSPDSVVVNETGESIPVSGMEGLGAFVSEEMGKSPGGWALSFGYVTLTPMRAYFTVQFGPEGKVVKVSDITWGGNG